MTYRLIVIVLAVGLAAGFIAMLWIVDDPVERRPWITFFAVSLCALAVGSFFVPKRRVFERR